MEKNLFITIFITSFIPKKNQTNLLIFLGSKFDIKNRARSSETLPYTKWPEDANTASEHTEDVRKAVKTRE